MIERGHFDIGNFFSLFFRLSIGGPALGLFVAVIFYQIMKRFLNSSMVFVVMSVLVCYLTFYLSESDFLEIKVSGILALVVLGLYLSSKLRGRVVGNLEESMHMIWHFLAWMLETLLFFITGGFLGIFFASDQIDRLEANDIWKILVF